MFFDNPSIIEYGDYTYGIPKVIGEGELRIGKYCSIAEDVKFILWGHHTEFFSTYPLGHTSQTLDCQKFDHPIKGKTTVGNDVWIGVGAIIPYGITIGDGAIISAGSYVTKNVKPYTVVGGNPAEFLYTRFDKKIVDLLMNLKWWDLPYEIVKENSPILMSNDYDKLMNFYNKMKGDLKLLVMSNCYNEESILPFYLDYYTNFIKADKIMIYDGGSTDNSANIALQYPNVEFIVDDKGKMDERNLRDTRNNGWKKYKDDYDWVIVCDMDEFIYHSNLKGLLKEYDKTGITIPKVNGYDMVSEKFPTFKKGKFLPSFIQNGVHEPIWLNKSAVFKPKKVEINYDFGTHSCSPTGDVKFSESSDIKLLQYKWLSHEYVTDKSLKASQRLSDWNLETGMAGHYKEYAKITKETFDNKLSSSVKIINDFPIKEKPIEIFWHCYLINNWEEIMEEQMKLIIDSGLYQKLNTCSIHLYYHGDEIQDKKMTDLIYKYDNDNKVIFHHIEKNYYEYPTLQALYDLAKTRDSYILYFHLKGVWSSMDKTRNSEAIRSWRKCLEYFNIEKWKDCVDKLDEGYEVVGALYNYNEKEPLFSGNFWWTTSDYIKKLKYPDYDPSKNPYLNTPEDDGTWCRVECEKWINTIPNKFYNFYKPKDYGFYFVPIDENDYRKNKISHIYQNIDGWFDFEGVYTDMVNRFQEGSHFVEIGSWLGKSTSYMAVEIANSFKKIKFDAIDTWESIGIYEIEKDPYNKFLNNIKPVGNYINPIRGKSEEISKNYEDNSLDFIFIDADHEYSSVKKDIECWYPKLKNGGYIGGHDYFENYQGLMKAVDEFFGAENITKIPGSTWLFQKNNPKISIIIPTHERFKLLEECVDSVLAQKYDNIEILVCHDGPSDELNEFRNYNDDRIKLYCLDKRYNNLGATQRNLMLTYVTGDYVLFLDDDNILYPNYLEKMVKNIDSETGMVVCRIHFNDNNWTNLILPRQDDLMPCEIDHLSILFRSDITKQFKWDSNWGQDHRYIKACENTILENGLKITYIQDVLANHRYLGDKKERPILVFHHSYLINNWKNILLDQINLMKDSGLYDASTNIYSTYYGDNERVIDEFTDLIKQSDISNKFILRKDEKNIGEFACLQMIYETCAGKSAYIGYFHTKGAYSESISANIGIKAWRDYLNYFTITKWKESIDKLKEGYDITSVNHDYNDIHHDYIVGGFLWTTSEYVKSLPYPTDNRFEAEIWIMKNKNKKIFEHFNSTKAGFRNLYLEPIPPSIYRKDDLVDRLWSESNNYRIQQKEREWKSLLNFILGSNIEKNKALEIGCYNLGGTHSLCNIFNDVTSIDIEKRNTWDDFESCHLNWKYFVGNSHSLDMINNIKNLNIKFDLIFIDGDHTYEGVKKDFYDYKEFLNDEGIILFHDILDTEFHKNFNCYVHDFWKEIKNEYNTTEFIDISEKIDSRFFQKDVPNSSWGGIGAIKFNKKNISKTCYVMTSHPNFKMSEDITLRAIESIKPNPIILSSHCPLSAIIQEKVDYIIYDKNNPLIRHDFFTQSWFDERDYYALINLTKNDNNFNHAMGVYLNYYNSLIYAKSLGYDIAVCTNFDLVFDEKDIKLIESKVETMVKEDKKAFFMNTPERDGEHFKTIFFITNIDYFLEHFKYTAIEKDYIDETRKVGSNTNCLENFFFHTLKDKKNELLLQTINENDLFSNSDINLFSLIEYATVLPVENDPESFVVWFSSANSLDSRDFEIEVNRNNSMVLNDYQPIDKQFKYWKKFKFTKGDVYDITFKTINQNDILKNKNIIVNDDVFKEIKDYGKFVIKN